MSRIQEGRLGDLMEDPFTASGSPTSRTTGVPFPEFHHIDPWGHCVYTLETAATAPTENVTIQHYVPTVLLQDNMTTKPSANVDWYGMRVANYLESLYHFEVNGQMRRAVREIVSHVDQLLNEGQIPECKVILRQADVTRLSPESLISLLGITLAATQQLGSSRSGFAMRARNQLVRQLGQNRADVLLHQYT